MKRPNLFKVLWRCFGLYACVPFVSGLMESVCKISEAVLLGYVIRFFDRPDMTIREGMGYAMGLFLLTLFRGTVHHHNFFHVLRIGTWTRQSLIALMYRKCLTLSTSSSISTGTVVNLISNDLQPFESWAPFGLYAILGPLEMIVVMYFLWKELGVACLAGLLALSLLMPIQAVFSRQFGSIRSKTVQARDDRIRTLSDVISGIELVKLCAWEVPFQEKVMMLRSSELKYIGKANTMRATNMAIYFFFLPLVALFAFVTYWLQGNALTPDKVFVSLTLFNILRLAMTSYFPKALESLAEVRVSVRRITDFLLLPELRSIEDDMDENYNDATTSPNDNKDSIHEKHADGSAVGLDTLKKAILSNITMTLRRDDLLAIVGPVGSGKSSFCMALLQEMALVSGSMDLAQRNRSTVQRSITMSYSAQSPWILAGSIRSNILFGSKFDRERYDKVIKACELTRDLSLFPQGDATIIGERGVTLSGGQRARVSLARAAYRKADVYILDDPLSAVDPKVGRALFDNCINGLLKGKARVLVTHQLQYIQDCDNVIVLEHGQITHKGHVDESIKTNTQFVNVLREFAKKATTQSHMDDDQSSDAEKTVRNNDHNTAVDVKDNGTRAADKEDDGASVMEKNLTTEEVAEGDTSLKAYVEFFRIGSTWAKLIFTLICLTAAQGIMVGGEFFLSEWSSQSATEQKRSYYPTVFGLFCLGTVIMTLFRSFLFIDCLTASSRNMFRAMLDAIMRTNIDFFHANPHGRVLNRFSKDMANCDELLPYVFFDTVQTGFMLIGSVVTVCVVNPWIIIAIPFILGGFMGLRNLYIKSSRQVKRIDSQSRSPIYSHLSETLDGLSSVRAFGASKQFMSEHIKTQEDNGRAFFTYLAMARWLGYRLDAVSALFLGVTAIACVAVRDTQQASKAGLAMASVISLSGELQWAIRMSVEAAILMVSVERMMEYAQVKPEESDRHQFNPDGSSVVPNGWPAEAKVTFTDMSLTYPRGDGPVLKNISLDFKGGERVGIVGRTGAGKSSLIGALFRLVETTTGSPPHRGGISIDGIDISKIGMHDLREKMAIIPQEPFLFRGTLRFNLDPLSQYQDADIWAALEAAELKHMVEGLQGGLDATVDDNGKNFSIGERQLLSLARAVLRRSKIIVMDEATANVDLRSDRMIQKAIHSLFRGATVFTIAHRLNTVIGDYDRILVLDQGRVMEFDEPWALLNNNDLAQSGGWLKSMVAGTGPENEAALRRLAKEQWEKRHASA
ncbi:MAG: P-loop containing nucleoside triphosphate hydrolase protein [Benniella sp.]|nr:MAG: P-loop containing nucleoside triphosphate hydrolase protein [Benniella sp.]